MKLEQPTICTHNSSISNEGTKREAKIESAAFLVLLQEIIANGGGRVGEEKKEKKKKKRGN